MVTKMNPGGEGSSGNAGGTEGGGHHPEPKLDPTPTPTTTAPAPAPAAPSPPPESRREELLKDYQAAGEHYEEVISGRYTAKELKDAVDALAKAKKAYDEEADKFGTGP